MKSTNTNNTDNILNKINKKNRNGEYKTIGYAPSWDGDFMYMASRLNGVSYQEKGNGFSWDDDAMMDTILFFREWTKYFSKRSMRDSGLSATMVPSGSNGLDITSWVTKFKT